MALETSQLSLMRWLQPQTTRVVAMVFFVIYVVAGVYEEYVSIPKYKQHLMMIGHGINQTIITGNHSVGGGYTTFNSYSFGKLQLKHLLFS